MKLIGGSRPGVTGSRVSWHGCFWYCGRLFGESHVPENGGANGSGGQGVGLKGQNSKAGVEDLAGIRMGFGLRWQREERPATPLWFGRLPGGETTPVRKSGVAAELCHRSPKLAEQPRPKT